RPRAANTWPGPPWLAGETCEGHLLPTLGEGTFGPHEAFSSGCKSASHSVRISTLKFHPQREQGKNGQFVPKRSLPSVPIRSYNAYRNLLNEYLVHHVGACGDHGA